MSKQLLPSSLWVVVYTLIVQNTVREDDSLLLASIIMGMHNRTCISIYIALPVLFNKISNLWIPIFKKWILGRAKGGWGVWVEQHSLIPDQYLSTIWLSHHIRLFIILFPLPLHKKSSSQIHITANLHFWLGLGPSQNPHVCNLRIKSHFN